jgi:MFS family permease
MKIIKTIGVGILVFTFFYLMCAFFNATFNISLWGETSRFVCSLGGGAFAVMAMVINSEFYIK